MFIYTSNRKSLQLSMASGIRLSDHEQVMIYYNAVAGVDKSPAFGEAWISNGYFTKYKMIHNLPLLLADFGITPEKKFEEEINENPDMFEWPLKSKTKGEI